MVFFISAICLLSSVRASKYGGLVVFDNFDSGSIAYGAENMADYAVLSVDRKKDVPAIHKHSNVFNKTQIFDP